jgi:hypothetical protein
VLCSLFSLCSVLCALFSSLLSPLSSLLSPPLLSLSRSNNDANKRTLVLKGGLDVILTAMATHSICREVQSQCLATLSSIGLRQPENCIEIVKKHGVPLILTAMQRLPGAGKTRRLLPWLLPWVAVVAALLV